MTSTADQKREVPSEFDRVAGTYDFLTGLNPGYSRHLRMSAARLLANRPITATPTPPRLLDLCCGTGASTEALVAEYPNAEVVALDASAEMLAKARTKPHLSRVSWIHGDATDPKAAGVTGTFDGVLMAYGIRNVPDADSCLSNIRELLKARGTVCFHEYSVKDSRISKLVWNAVSMGIIIPSGYLVGGDATIYRYLRRSVLEFDGASAFLDRLTRAGFVDVRDEPMDGWQKQIVHSFLARRP